MNINFPSDFKRKAHRIPGAIQFTPLQEQPVFISIVGGPRGCGLYGNGITSFELMIGDKVEGWLSPEDINKRINKVLELITD